jgi:hypothetical protein
MKIRLNKITIRLILNTLNSKLGLFWTTLIAVVFLSLGYIPEVTSWLEGLNIPPAN